MRKCRLGTLRTAAVRYASTATQQSRRPRGRPRKQGTSSNNHDPTSGQLDARGNHIESDQRLRTPSDLGLQASQVDLSLGSDLAPAGRIEVARDDSGLATGSNVHVPRVAMIQSATKHHDLQSFLDHAARTKMSIDSSVYRGTFFEYLAAQSLLAYGFHLRRVGRSNDLGIDLIGTWTLPTTPSEMNVLVQCKATQPSPAMIRELEGAYIGAPAGWQTQDTMALLVATKPATKGVRDALQRSKLPMGVAQITNEGVLSQFLWNHVVAESRLTGLGTVIAHATACHNGDGQAPASHASRIALTWLGKIWPGS